MKTTWFRDDRITKNMKKFSIWWNDESSLLYWEKYEPLLIEKNMSLRDYKIKLLKLNQQNIYDELLKLSDGKEPILCTLYKNDHTQHRKMLIAWFGVAGIIVEELQNVKEKTSQYDLVFNNFINERCEIGKFHKSTTDMFCAYNAYCIMNNEIAFKRRTFNKLMKERSFYIIGTGSHAYFEGVKLKCLTK